MEFEYEYRREDETFRSASLWKRLASPTDFFRSRYAAFAFLPLILLCYLVIAGYVTVAAAVLGWFTAFAWFWSRNVWAGMRIAADEASPIYGRKTCRIDDKGISIESSGMKSWYSWTTVRDVTETEKYVSIYYDLIRAVVVPKKSFRTPEERGMFMNLVQKYVQVSKIGEGPRPAAEPAPRLRLAMPMLWIFVLAATFALTNITTSLTGFDQVPEAAATVDKATVVDDSIVVLGTLKNTGKSDWRISTLELKFLDGDGKFIDQCTAYTYSLSVKAGATENFKATCGTSQREGVAVAGTTIMPSTLKHYAHIEVRAQGGFKSGLWPMPY